jgi:hypothetical protein
MAQRAVGVVRIVVIKVSLFNGHYAVNVEKNVRMFAGMPPVNTLTCGNSPTGRSGVMTIQRKPSRWHRCTVRKASWWDGWRT